MEPMQNLCLRIFFPGIRECHDNDKAREREQSMAIGFVHSTERVLKRLQCNLLVSGGFQLIG
jgi:hypothetical protein